jgi:probable F420-dependent oxidoreductase
MSRPLKVGLKVPVCERESRSETPRWEEIKQFAQLAEEAGFDGLWFEDHLLFRHYEGQEEMGCWEAMSMMAAVAAVTERITIGPMVAPISFRNPALTAKIADTLDEISGGRFVLGIGAGWNDAEYEAFGFPTDHRFSRFEEALTIIHTLLRTGQIDFEGKYYSARDCSLRPRGPRNDGIPLLIAGTGDKMLNLIARYADAWNLGFRNYGPETELREKLNAACRAIGRDPETLEHTAMVYVDLSEGSSDPNAYPTWPGIPGLKGSLDEIAEQLIGYGREGITDLQVWLHPITLESAERFAPIVEILKRERA